MIDPKEDIDWVKLKELIESQEAFVSEDGTKLKEVYLGSVIYLTPSGKYYTAWCTNATEEEITADAEWFDTLDEEAEKHNLYITSGADPCDIMVGMVVDDEEDEFQ